MLTASGGSITLTGASSNSTTFTIGGLALPTTIAAGGTAAGTHSVNLSWNPSNSSGISGYNVYRSAYSGNCGSFNKINSVVNTGTLYTDSTVANGGSYCYAATTIDSSNQESGYSNIVSNVQIPAQ